MSLFSVEEVIYLYPTLNHEYDWLVLTDKFFMLNEYISEWDGHISR